MPRELLFRFGCNHCDGAFETEEEAIKCETGHEDRMKDAKIKGYRFSKKKRGFFRSVVGEQTVPTRITIQLSERGGDYATFELVNYGPKAV